MKEKDWSSWGGVAIVLVFVAFCVLIVSVFTYSVVVASVCKQVGWNGGGAKSAYDGFCFERNADDSEYRECKLPYVLAGECEPLWPGAE